MFTLTDKRLCKTCFADLCERKLRKNLRTYKLKRDERVIVFDNTSKQVFQLLVPIPMQFAFSTLEDRGLILHPDQQVCQKTIERSMKKHCASRLIIPWTLDDENERFLLGIFSYTKEDQKKENQMMNQEKKIIKLFEPLSRDETQRYCQIKSIPFQSNHGDLGSALDKFEEKYPGTKTSIAQSAKDFRRRFPHGART